MNLRADSDLSVYGCIHLLKKVEKIQQANSLSMLKSQRQDFADLDWFILCLDFFSETNADLLCILLFSTDCSLYSVIKVSCIIHTHSKTIMLKLSKLLELLPRVLEFFCNLRL